MNHFKKKFCILLIVGLIFIPQLSFAESTSLDLDDSFQQFRSEYVKEDKQVRLSAVDDAQEINDRRMIVKLEADANFDPTVFGVRLVEKIDDQMYIVQAFPDDDYELKLTEIEAAAQVLYVEPDFLIEVSYTPKDPLFKNQWYLDRIRMKDAWNITRGSSDITIAVLDSGINANHPDLKGRVLSGYNFITKDTNTTDDNGHGTHIAGVIAANANNIGGIGIDHAAKILPVKIFNDRGSGSVSDSVKGINYAVKQGADVINMSYVTSEQSKAETEALWNAYHQGIVLVAAAGNEGLSKSKYPASYPHVISVAATNEEDQRAKFSNNNNWIDIAAPGTDIYSTNYLGGYGIQHGTSFSAPIISALAALVKAEHPQWKPNEIEWALESGAQSFGGIEWSDFHGFGRVDAYETLTAELPVLMNDAGDASNKAKRLENGITVREKIDLPLDVDWFTFDVPIRSNVYIQLFNLPTHIDLVGVLYKEDGSKVDTLSVIDRGGMGETESRSVEVGPGTYYLSVYDYHGHWSTNSYHVKMEMETNLSFPDVKSYKKEIEYLTSKDIIRGFPDGMFRPRNNVTRIQAVHMVLREMGIDVKNVNAPNPGFNDMKPTSYGYEAVAAAVELGFIKGKPNNTFDPYGYLTRAQMASILVNAYQLEGTHDKTFKDIPSSHWAKDLISTLATNNITTGFEDGTFKPERNISREHFAVFMYRLMEGER